MAKEQGVLGATLGEAKYEAKYGSLTYTCRISWPAGELEARKNALTRVLRRFMDLHHLRVARLSGALVGGILITELSVVPEGVRLTVEFSKGYEAVVLKRLSEIVAKLQQPNAETPPEE